MFARDRRLPEEMDLRQLREAVRNRLGCLGPLRRWMTVGLRLLEDLHGPE
jgi:hypothetical protein